MGIRSSVGILPLPIIKSGAVERTGAVVKPRPRAPRFETHPGRRSLWP